MEVAAGIVGLIGFGLQLCSTIDNILSSYRSSSSELAAVSANVLTLCDVLSVLDKQMKVKRTNSFGSSSDGNGVGISSLAKPRSLNYEEAHQVTRTQEEVVLSESQACLQNVLDKCWGCLLDIQRLIQPFRKDGKSSMMVKFKWMRKKSDIQSVMTSLESCKSTLSLTLLVMRYCTDDDEEVNRNDIAVAIQKQAEELKSEKDANYAFVMQRYLDCASSTIGSPKSTLVQGADDVESVLVLDDNQSTHSLYAEPEQIPYQEESDRESFKLPFSGSEGNVSQTSLLSVSVYEKVGNERKEQRRRKRASRDSGIAIEDDDISIISKESNMWKPFLSLSYKLEWYRRNFRQDINGRLTSIQQMTDTCEFNIEELLLTCKNYSRPVTPIDNGTPQQLRKKRSRDKQTFLRAPLKPREEDFFRSIVRIQKALANLSTIRANALEVIATPATLVRSSSLPLSIQTQSQSKDPEAPLRPYILEALNILLKSHNLSERLHQKLQELTSQRDQASKSSILSRLQVGSDTSRFEHTKRTFSNIEDKLSLKYARERYTRCEELWRSTHDVIKSTLEAEFFFFDDMDRILSAAVQEPVEKFNTLSRKNSMESEMLDSDVNRGYSALVASAERQKSYTVLDQRLRGIMLSAKTSVAIAGGRIEFIPGQGKTLDELIMELEEDDALEKDRLDGTFKYLNEYVNSYVVNTMGRLEVALAKFGERLYIPLKKSVTIVE
ncbi:hypothetical protein H072_1557 [Dactylellina haptotyla CBS 200.50]|uniref:Fungal N-terminal domain-containing protein n=1 Tax=Dactylellina haptotyla (strain CBS 200.50) TaxID=1284197 RepID=S8ANB9_DACHA|nr:hypothetical protein H072_1557 [Dactylellina haptotyla CBS 200.50]